MTKPWKLHQGLIAHPSTLLSSLCQERKSNIDSVPSFRIDSKNKVHLDEMPESFLRQVMREKCEGYT